MIYVLYGEDTFSAFRALNALRDAVGPADLRESNVTELDGSAFDLARLTAAAMVAPFLGARRLVIVRGLLAAHAAQRQARRGARPGRPADGVAEPLVAALGKLPPTTDIAFVDEALRNDNPLLTALRALGAQLHVREFPALRYDALARWATEQAAVKGVTLDPDAARMLADLVGSNLWQMDREIEKLATYVSGQAGGPGRAVSADDVRALVSNAREAKVYELVDAIMERRTDRAMGVLQRLLGEGESGPGLVAMIARQARAVALAQALAVGRVPQVEWGKRLGINQEFVLRKTTEQARRFSPEAVRALYRLLLEADLAMKTGETPDDLAMLELVMQAGSLTTASTRGV